jgi:pyruvoyl-dependent arginine decarboxylase (PvlArgDC)
LSVGVIICPARPARQHFKANPIAISSTGILRRSLRHVNLNQLEKRKPDGRFGDTAYGRVDSALEGSKIYAAMGFAVNRDGHF